MVNAELKKGERGAVTNLPDQVFAILWGVVMGKRIPVTVTYKFGGLVAFTLTEVRSRKDGGDREFWMVQRVDYFTSFINGYPDQMSFAVCTMDGVSTTLLFDTEGLYATLEEMGVFKHYEQKFETIDANERMKAEMMKLLAVPSASIL